MLEQALRKYQSKSLIKDKFGNFIRGDWVARGMAEDIELALDAAHKVKGAWGRTSHTERSNILNRVAQRIEDNLDMMALVETIGNGKPIRETTAADLPLAVDHFPYFAGSPADTDARAIVIDTGPSLSFGRALKAAAQRLTGMPVARVYITHLHPDHSFGNGAFGASEIHALPATRAELERDGTGLEDAMYRLLPGWIAGTEIVLPQHEAVSGVIHFGGRSFELLAMAGHSEGDLVILDHASGTLIAGDLVFHNRAPATPHADLTAWLAALDTLEALDHRQLVPGHGPICTNGTAIAQTRDWLSWLNQALRNAVASGLDMTEAGNLPIPERFEGLAEARYELTRSVAHFYPRLEAEMFLRIDR